MDYLMVVDARKWKFDPVRRFGEFVGVNNDNSTAQFPQGFTNLLIAAWDLLMQCLAGSHEALRFVVRHRMIFSGKHTSKIA
jgi:hypothetical protein